MLVPERNIQKDGGVLRLMSGIGQTFWCEIRNQWQALGTCINCKKRKCKQRKEVKEMAKTAKNSKEEMFPVADGSGGRQLKILITGPRGQYKTRSILQMCDVPRDKTPILAIIDTENGTEYYDEEFHFRRRRVSDPDEIVEASQFLFKSPGDIKAVALDSHSVHFAAVKSKYSDLYLKRLPSSSGNKSEFYIFQPNDHEPYRKEINDLMRDFSASGLHFMWTCHVVDKWKGMKVTGEKPDGVKGLEHWFDTVIQITEKANGVYVATVEKDRTGTLVEKKTFPWKNQEDAFALFAPFRKIIHGDNGVGETKETVKDPVKEAAKETPKETAKDTKQPAEEKTAPADTKALTTTTADPKALLMEIVKLKKELRILDKKEWDKLLVPFKVKTAKDLSTDQLGAFISTLEAMRPTEAPPF